MTSHLIVVSATDQLTSIASQVVIVVNVTNENDGALIITASAAASVSEMSSKGSFVALITATDSDSNSVIRYHISSGNTNGLFTIDASTGIVRLNGSLNYDTAASHMVTICATETTSGALKCQNLTVNVRNENNKPTVFGQTSYQSNTPLNSTVGTLVAQITATDPDGLSKFRYTLDGATANEYFSINETTGAITLKKSMSGASLPNPVVVVGCASDNGNPPTTTCVPVIVNTGWSILILPLLVFVLNRHTNACCTAGQARKARQLKSFIIIFDYDYLDYLKKSVDSLLFCSISFSFFYAFLATWHLYDYIGDRE